jgi:hypothetical protein
MTNRADGKRRVLLDELPLDLVWLHLAHGHRPSNAAGVRILPALELSSGSAVTLAAASARAQSAQTH